MHAGCLIKYYTLIYISAGCLTQQKRSLNIVKILTRAHFLRHHVQLSKEELSIMFYGSTYKQLTGRFLSQRGLFQQLAGLFWGILPIIIEALVVFSPLLQSKIKIRFFKFLLHFCGVNSRFGFPKYCSTFVALFWERNSIVLSLKVHRHENKSCSACLKDHF